MCRAKPTSGVYTSKSASLGGEPSAVSLSAIFLIASKNSVTDREPRMRVQSLSLT
ncbi:hypothetical protein Scep_010068 [Stephania cephalantha]|uniref:Uncharacterized protein n=1 Tax=Stephania cephalantha TaxID=152367 RepID=A0AAP0JWT0_9MAGN